MKRIIVLLVVVLSVCDLNAQTYSTVTLIKQAIADSIVSNRQLKAPIFNKILNSISNFLPDVVNDTADVTSPKIGMIRFQRSDSTNYTYDGHWKKTSSGTVAGQTTGNFLGTIFTQNSFSSLTGFTNNGGTFSTSSGAITGASGAADFAQSLDLNYYTALEHYKINSIFKLTATGTNGFGIGFRSGNPSFPANYVAWFRPYDGLIRIEGEFSTSSYYAASSAVSFSLNDFIEFSLQREGNLYTATVRNITANTAPVSVSYRHDLYYGVSYIMQSTAKPAIFSVGGNFSCTKFELISTETKAADVAIIGDSKTSGYWSGLFIDRFASLLGKNMNVVTLGGSGDRSTEWLARIDELIALHPKRVILTNPSNDARFGVSSGTSHSNYAAIVSALQGAGIEVFHMEAFYESSQDNSSWNTYIAGAYPSDHIIPMYDVLQVAGALQADGIHPTQYGDKLIYERILLDGKINTSRGFLREHLPIIETLDGEILLRGSSSDVMTRLRFGGITSAFPMIQVNATGLEVRRADNSLFMDWWARDISAAGGFSVGGPVSNYLSGPRAYFQFNSAAYGDSWDNSTSTWYPWHFRGTEINFDPNNTTVLSVKPAFVGIGTTTVNNTAVLEITSTTKGILFPRMTTTQRDAITSPSDWLTIICTDCTATDGSTGVMQIRNNSASVWKNAW